MWRVVFVALFVTVFARAASAQTGAAQTEVRRQALDRAAAARAIGNHSEAVRYGELAGQVQMTPSLRLFLAEEFVALGQMPEAMEHAIPCVRESGLPGTNNGAEIQARCEQIVRTGEDATGRVLIELSEVDRRYATARFGRRQLLGPALLLPVLVDVGPQRIEITVPERGTWSTRIDVRPGQELRLRPDFEQQGAQNRGVPVGPLALVLAGSVLAATGIGFGIARFVAVDPSCAIRTNATNSYWLCDTDAQADAAVNAAIFERVGVSVGSVGLAVLGAGVLWWVLPRRAEPTSEARRPSVQWFARGTGNGMLVGGRW